ncbi:hypothetical protein Psuf_061610 [Phytohabitans suffuscus]|uniref:Uncharacterized protein n=1 Tax=Phytohabitans suffuscus TaxID=624315 RepID=A0A6F8YSD9_9ACTN|nr:hypothetical protein Psuf_061610 [Phytohabitans suffuscus]
MPAGAQVRRVPTGGFLGEQDPDEFGGSQRCAFAVGMTSAMALRRCGSLSRLVSVIASSNAAPVTAATAEAPLPGRGVRV